MRFQEAERVGLELLTQPVNEGLPSDAESLDRAVSRLHALLANAHRYVDGVCEGRLPPNNTIGRFLARPPARHAGKGHARVC